MWKKCRERLKGNPSKKAGKTVNFSKTTPPNAPDEDEGDVGFWTQQTSFKVFKQDAETSNDVYRTPTPAILMTKVPHVTPSEVLLDTGTTGHLVGQCDLGPAAAGQSAAADAGGPGPARRQRRARCRAHPGTMDRRHPQDEAGRPCNGGRSEPRGIQETLSVLHAPGGFEAALTPFSAARRLRMVSLKRRTP